MNSWTEDMIKEVEELNNNAPDGQIIDADTILMDLIQENDFDRNTILRLKQKG